MKSISRYILNFCIIALAYYMCGRLGLMLDIQPGHASAIWPASGVALTALIVRGYQYFPAILAGALGTSLFHYIDIDLHAFLISFIIACGASIQALFGAWIVKRMIAFPTNLENVGEISRVILGGGVLSCCINASIGTAAIFYAGMIDYSIIVSHWYTWWIGDLFGVLIFAPVLLLIFSKFPRKSLVGVKRKLNVAIPVLITNSLFEFLFLSSKIDLKNRAFGFFYEDAVEISNGFHEGLIVDLNIFVALQSLMNASDFVSSKDFYNFTSKFLEQSPEVSGLSWIPKITHDKRKEFEESIREQGYPEYKIRRRFARGVLKESEEKPVYLPLAYTQPYESNKKAHGFDVYGQDEVGKNIRIAPLDQARDMAMPRATARFPIVQQEDQYGFIVYHPVYNEIQTDKSVEWRRENLLGYMNGIFVFPKLMENVRLEALELGIDIVLMDLSASEEKRILYDSRTDKFKEGDQQTYDFLGMNVVSKKFNMAGRVWELIFIKEKSFLPPEHIRDLWFIVICGSLFTGLLSFFMLIVTARTETVERLVDQKTADLLAANVELEEFSYRTSHDLRSPIISSLAILGLIPNMISIGKNKEAIEGIAKVQGSLNKLKNLIDDILHLTEVKNKEEDDEVLNLTQIIDDSLEKLEHMDGFTRLEIKRDHQEDISILTQRVRLSMIVENFLSNAIKYQDPHEKNSFIKVRTFSEEKYIIIEFSDNGLGIPENQAENLFKMFKRFHPKVAYGTGLGLHLIKKSADAIGAIVEFENLEKGSLFRLKIKGK